MELKQLEHPDITDIQRNGYPAGVPPENADTPQARMEFVEDHADEFVRFCRFGGDQDVIDRFIDHYRGIYLNWLN
ncbi:MAG: hypothetical protein H6Q60_1172 [Oscillospiraceae bacterium]|nr:hypothetical protein [Oscillospiraceae bacterium]